MRITIHDEPEPSDDTASSVFIVGAGIAAVLYRPRLFAGVCAILAQDPILTTYLRKVVFACARRGIPLAAIVVRDIVTPDLIHGVYKAMANGLACTSRFAWDSVWRAVHVIQARLATEDALEPGSVGACNRIDEDWTEI